MAALPLDPSTLVRVDNGKPVRLDAFMDDNRDGVEPEEMSELLVALMAGRSYSFGGGAAPLVTVALASLDDAHNRAASVANSADAAWAAELRRLFGPRAGEMRATARGLGEDGSHLRELADAFSATNEARRVAYNALLASRSAGGR